MKTDSFTFPDVAWQAVKRRRALKEKGLALGGAEGPLTKGEELDFFTIMRNVKLLFLVISTFRANRSSFASINQNVPLLESLTFASGTNNSRERRLGRPVCDKR